MFIKVTELVMLQHGGKKISFY